MIQSIGAYTIMLVPMHKLVLIFCLLVPMPTWSQNFWVHISGHSWHDQSGFNQNNIGIGIETVVHDKWSAAVGTYHNSIYRDTWYLLAKHQFWTQGAWTAQINMGVATGYQIRPVAPVLLPELCVHWLCGMAVPRVGDYTTPALALYLRIPF